MQRQAPAPMDARGGYSRVAVAGATVQDAHPRPRAREKTSIAHGSAKLIRSLVALSGYVMRPPRVPRQPIQLSSAHPFPAESSRAPRSTRARPRAMLRSCKGKAPGGRPQAAERAVPSGSRCRRARTQPNHRAWDARRVDEISRPRCDSISRAPTPPDRTSA